MTKKELEEVIYNHELSFAYMSAKLDALHNSFIELASALGADKVNFILYNYYKSLYENFSDSTSDLEDSGAVNSKLHELHQLMNLYKSELKNGQE